MRLLTPLTLGFLLSLSCVTAAIDDTVVLTVENFQPIQSVDLVQLGNITYCRSHSIVPVDYQLVVLFALNQDNIIITENTITSSGNQFAVVVCVASTRGRIHGQIYRRRTVATIGRITNGNEKVRLIHGNSPKEGIIQFLHQGQWRYICDDDFQSQGTQESKNGRVVCHELGYHDVHELVPDGRFGEETEPFYMDTVKCEGDESSLLDCPSDRGINAGDCEDLEFDHPASIVCQGANTTLDKSTVSTINDLKPTLTVLRRGSQRLEARCSCEFNFNQQQQLSFYRVAGDGERHDLLEEISNLKADVDRLARTIRLYATVEYRPMSNTEGNSRFICAAEDVLSGVKVEETITPM